MPYFFHHIIKFKLYISININLLTIDKKQSIIINLVVI